MNKIKKRLLSYSLLLAGGLNSGARISNAQPKNDTNTSNVSSENSKRNLKISNILTARNGTDFIGLCAIIFGGKKLWDKNKSLEKLNRDKSTFEQLYKNKINDIELFYAFQHLFFLCFEHGVHLGEYCGWQDLAKKDFKDYKTVVVQQGKYGGEGEYDGDGFGSLGCYFVAKKELAKTDHINMDEYHIDSNELLPVLARVPCPEKLEEFEYDNKSPLVMAGYYVWRESNNNAKFRIIKFEELLKKLSPGDNIFNQKQFDKWKEKFKNYYIICEYYRNKRFDSKKKDDAFYKFSLVKSVKKDGSDID